MNPISQTRLATLAGVTKQRITAVIKADPPQVTIIIDGKGKKKIDLDGHLTAKYLQGRTPTPEQPREPNKSKAGRPLDHTEPSINPYQGENDYQSESNNPSGTGTGSTSVAKNLKDRNTQLTNEALEIKIGQTRGNLVQKKLSINIFSQIYNIHENQFKSISVKTNPKIESVYTSEYQDKATEILKELGLTNKKEAKKTILKILNIGESARFRRLTEIMEDETMAILKNIQFEIDRYLRLSEVK